MPRLRVVAVAARLPAWAEQACAEYARRMPRGYEVERVSLKKLPARKEAWIVLDEKGQSMTTKQFAALLKAEASFLIGGAEGLPDEVKKNARLLLRISSLTLPHALAQVVLLEQIYRSATILTGHPYHRA
ncbi:MAG TPA: 23S rRNA (pseudouridine(1915)-N(3))-methyltransferase RlmH [Burkholderiales bacterium]|nr:23S rRNA (pseudouridine(1915)-N(3))-methyltransferase RlmH [Burkholderiales bacterium]